MQNTDLSVYPYLDDYNPDKHFHRVLFRPRTVQVRELQAIQSYCIEQHERLGRFLFQEGSVVIPGGINVLNRQDGIAFTINPGYTGITTAEDLVNLNTTLTLKSTASYQSAIVQKIIPSDGSDSNNILFIDYLDSGTATSTSQTYIIGDVLDVLNSSGIAVARITVGNTTSSPTIGPTVGVWVKVLSGVYFIRGFFVSTENQDIVIDKYNINASGSVGFTISENIVQSDNNSLPNYDSSLLSNATGELNYKAPGADRLQIILTLSKHNLGYQNDSYIELVQYNTGNLQKKVDNTVLSDIGKILAQRTYEESGNYTVTSFPISIVDDILDIDHPNGLYLPSGTPAGDESKYVVQVKPGIGYVMGYRVQNIGITPVITDKARVTQFVNNSAAIARYGCYLLVNALLNTPSVDATHIYQLRDNTSTTIGYFKVRACQVDTSFNATIPASTVFRIYIYDISFIGSNTFNSVRTIYYSDGSNTLIGTILAFDGSASSDTKVPVLYDSSFNTAIFPIPYSGVSTLYSGSGPDTSYDVFRMFTTTTDSSGVITISASSNELFTSINTNDYTCFKTGAGDNPLYISTSPTLTGTPVGRSITFTLKIDATTAITTPTAVNILAPVLKQNPLQRTKTLSIDTIENLTFNIGDSIKALSHIDIFNVSSIIDTTTELDVSGSFIIDNGQRDNWYEEGKLKRIDTTTAIIVQVTYKYFSHSSGDYFSVDSYSGIPRYKIPTYQSATSSYNLADCIDFRKDKISGVFSPPTSGEMIRPNDTIRFDITYYLPRYDSLCVDSSGNFFIVHGDSIDKPVPPGIPSDSMRLYNLFVPAYTANVSDIIVTQIDNRRYTMRDIGALDKRISNIEYYTSLSLLELKSNNTDIIDPVTGNNRFKNGFAADNFTDFKLSDLTDLEWNASIDPTRNLLVAQSNKNAIDFTFNTGSGYKKGDNIYTLDYTETLEISQPYSTGWINVNPYAVFMWIGTVKLNPISDYWHDVVYNPPLVQSSFVDNTLGLTAGTTSQVIGQSVESDRQIVVKGHARGGFKKDIGVDLITDITNQSIATTTTTITSNTLTNVNISKIGDNLIIPYMRTIDINFTLEGFKPFTKLYPFFENKNISAYCTPTGGFANDPIITDRYGSVSGKFTVPTNPDKFTTGKSIFRFSDSNVNSYTDATTFGESEFVSGGTYDLYQETTSYTTTRNATVDISYSQRSIVNSHIEYVDPIAQSFITTPPGGCFISSIDLFFYSKSNTIPINIQIRTVENGIPTGKILPFGQVTVIPTNINTSTDGTVATNIKFNDLVYLSDGQEFAIIVIANTQEYQLHFAEIGKGTLTGNYAVSKQPYAGTFFTSSNGSTWTPNQLQDLKFNIYRADFVNSGTLNFNCTAPTQILLEPNALSSTLGSPIINVHIKSHGLKVGDTFQILNGTAGNGVFAVDINTTHTVTGVTNGSIDDFQFTLSYNATSSGSFGGMNISAICNYSFISIIPNIETFDLNGAVINWTFNYIDQLSRTTKSNLVLTPQTYIDLLTEGVVRQSGDFSITANMSSSSSNLSPTIDSSGFTTSLFNKRINNSFDYSLPNVYDFISKKIMFDNPTRSFKVYVGVNLPGSSKMKVYFKPIHSADNDLTSVNWIELISTVPITNDDLNFIEYEYDKNIDLSDATFSISGFKLKVSFNADSPLDVPELLDIRTIALA